MALGDWTSQSVPQAARLPWVFATNDGCIVEALTTIFKHFAEGNKGRIPDYRESTKITQSMYGLYATRWEYDPYRFSRKRSWMSASYAINHNASASKLANTIETITETKRESSNNHPTPKVNNLSTGTCVARVNSPSSFRDHTLVFPGRVGYQIGGGSYKIFQSRPVLTACTPFRLVMAGKNQPRRTTNPERQAALAIQSTDTWTFRGKTTYDRRKCSKRYGRGTT